MAIFGEYPGGGPLPGGQAGRTYLAAFLAEWLEGGRAVDPDSPEAQILAEEEFTAPRFTVSAAAERAGMHPQTLRQYDRLGLVVPARTRGGGRRYSHRDIMYLVEIQRLSQEEGVNLAGIRRIMELERQVDALRAANNRLSMQAREANRVFAADASGQVTAMDRGQRAAAAEGESRSLVLRARPPAPQVVHVQGSSTALVVYRSRP